MKHEKTSCESRRFWAEEYEIVLCILCLWDNGTRENRFYTLPFYKAK